MTFRKVPRKCTLGGLVLVVLPLISGRFIGHHALLAQSAQAAHIAGISNADLSVDEDVRPVCTSYMAGQQFEINTSSRRYKEDIRDMGSASDGLLRLRPVTFRFKKPFADGSQPLQYGLIAEEVAEVYPSLVVRGKDGQVETVQYYNLDAMLLNEVQKLAKQHAADQREIAKLQSEIADQGKRVETQQAAMKRLEAWVRVIQLTFAHGGSAGGIEHRVEASAPRQGGKTVSYQAQCWLDTLRPVASPAERPHR